MKHSYDPSQILSGAHFQPMDRILTTRFGTENGAIIKSRIREQLCVLLENHQNDDEALWEESSNYILPSISIYLILRNSVGSQEALDLFRAIYFEAAHEGAAFYGRNRKIRPFGRSLHMIWQGIKRGNAVDSAFIWWRTAPLA